MQIKEYKKQIHVILIMTFVFFSSKCFIKVVNVKTVDFLIKAYFLVSPDSPGTHCSTSRTLVVGFKICRTKFWLL